MQSMKLKARNIIPGWPRSKSTMCISARKYEWKPLFETAETYVDRMADAEYHREQQEMQARCFPNLEEMLFAWSLMTMFPDRAVTASSESRRTQR